MGWTDERVELLRKLWGDGLSASQIARQLGGVTRNAVIGKVHRLGLTGRAAPSRPQRTVFRAPSAPRPLRPRESVPSRTPAAAKAKPATRPAPRYVDEGPGIATPMTIGAHMCKWPIGDPCADHFTFCGRRSEAGPYCCEHASVAYQPASKKKTPSELARSLRRYL